MTSIQAKRILIENKIPLADIKVVFDGYFHISFDSAEIEKRTIPDSLVYDTLQKLKAGYPANYLAGYMDVQGLHILLNEHTLIPRNETIQFIYSYLSEKNLHQKTILDLCTGSGVIALSIKKLFPDSLVYASDISEECLTIAKHSAELNHLDIHFLHSDYLKDIPLHFDVIISNPPYIEEENRNVSAPFEPKLALFSGKDGLDSYRSIFSDLDSHLSLKGNAFFEIEDGSAKKVSSLLKEIVPNFTSQLWKDWYQRERYLLVKRINPV